MSDTLTVTLTVNGRRCTRTAPAHHTLLRWLRDAGFWEVRYGCGEGVCGACTVLVDGQTVSGCLVLAAQVDGAEVRTAVGLLEDGEMGPIQKAFLDSGAVQCGFCTSGMLLAGQQIIEADGPVGRESILRDLEGNLCRCTGYDGIVDAIETTAAARRRELRDEH